MRKLLFIGGLILTGISLSLITQAAQLALTPLVFDLKGKPGEIVEGEVRVLNPSYDATVTVKMSAEDMFPEGEEGRVILQLPPDEKTSLALSQWISFVPEVFDLAPREEKAVKFRIKIPENADPGGHYAGILAGVHSGALPEETGVAIVTRVASLILLAVEGEMKEDLRVVEFSSPSYLEYGPINFVLRFENKGTVHVRPNAEIKIEDIYGREIARLSVDSRNILPKAVRKFETSWNQKWLWGIRYRAILSGTYGRYGNATNKIEPVVIVFWAFPWKVGLIGLAFLIFLFITRRRWITAIKILVKGEAAITKENLKNKNHAEQIK